MGHLEKGKWIKDGVIPDSKDGSFKRQEQKFREEISPGGFHPPEKDRYHLYVSYACPWAHRTLIFRELKGLREILPFSVVSPLMMEDGWTFREDFPGVIPDPVLNKDFLREIYTEADPEFTGKVTVPVLFDKKLKKIVNNESSEVIRILNSAFNDLTGNRDDFYPERLRRKIDAINDDVYDNVNNGVYKTGFAQSQDVYEENFKNLFACLDRLEAQLEDDVYLLGDVLTEADVRLYTTLVRFDAVYYVHFKCNSRLIRDYPNLSRYLSDLYALEAFRSTTHFDHIKAHYYYSHRQLNPFGIIPRGPSPLICELHQVATDRMGERPEGNSPGVDFFAD